MRLPSFEKLPFIIDMLSDATVDVGKMDTDHKDNFHYDDDFNYMVVYKSLIKKKGQEVIIKCKRNEIMGPFQAGKENLFIARPSPSYFFGALGLFTDDVLGQMIDLIINECNGHLTSDMNMGVSRVNMTEIDKKYLLDILKEKYMDKIKDESIRLLSKSIMGRMITETIHEHERVLTDRDILKKELDTIDQEAKRVVTRTGREEVLSEIEQEAKSIKDVGFVEVIRQEKKP